MWQNKIISILFLFVCSYFFSINNAWATNDGETTFYLKEEFSPISKPEEEANGINTSDKQKASRYRSSKSSYKYSHSKKKGNPFLSMLGIDTNNEVFSNIQKQMREGNPNVLSDIYDGVIQHTTRSEGVYNIFTAAKNRKDEDRSELEKHLLKMGDMVYGGGIRDIDASY